MPPPTASWGYNDPVEYIATAHSLMPVRDWAMFRVTGDSARSGFIPPFYSLVLAVFGLFKANLIVASRWLNIIAFVACILMAGWIFFRYSRAPVMGILTSAHAAGLPQMLWMFSSAYLRTLVHIVDLVRGLTPRRLSAQGTNAFADCQRSRDRSGPGHSLRWDCHGRRGGIKRAHLLLRQTGNPVQESALVWADSQLAGPGLVGFDLFFE